LEIHNVREIIGLDNNESELFFLEQKFANYDQASFFIADIRDRDKLIRKMEGIQVVFHTAAFKHVILCERSPFEAVQTNVIGVQNVILAASVNQVEKVIFTSSDKAVNPTNVMGTSKLMGERLMTAANSTQKNSHTIFASTRFGNVLGSRGSVIPIFREQIRKSGPVTITDPEMTRFIMSIEEAVKLVVDSAILARGGEVFVTKMPVMNIKDLAEVMIGRLSMEFNHMPENINTVYIGTKPGEKMYEELMNIEETRRSLELEKYFVVIPAFGCIYKQVEYNYPDIKRESVGKPYHSGNETPLSKDQLLNFLETNNLFSYDSQNSRHPDQRYWPDGSCRI